MLRGRYLIGLLSGVAIVSSLLVIPNPATSQTAGGIVALQPLSPGVTQMGNTHISGISRASQFIGGGIGITSVDADLLDGLNSTAFSLVGHVHNASAIVSGILSDDRLSTNVALLNSPQSFTAAKIFSVPPSFTSGGMPFIVSSNALVTNLNADLLDGMSASAFLTGIPNPLTLTGSQSGSHIIRGENTAGTSNSIGVLGISTGASFQTYGGYFQSNSGTGVLGTSTNVGVRGTSSGPTLPGYGGYFDSVGTSGRGVFGLASASTGTTYGGYFQSNSSSGRGVFGLANSTTGTTYAGYFANVSSSGFGVYAETQGLYAVYGVNNQTSGTTYGGYFSSNGFSGIGVYARAEDPSGPTTAGYFENDSSAGQAVRALSAGTFGLYASTSKTTGVNYGGYFSTASNDGRGVRGIATATSGTTYGGYFSSDSTTNGYGVYGTTDGPIGVFGSTTQTSGTGKGGQFVSPSSEGIGAFGYASATTGMNYGLSGQSDSTSGRGVQGYASAGSGSTYGVYGVSASATGRGVYGVASAASGTNYAGYFESNSVSGYGIYATTVGSYGIFGLSSSTSGLSVGGKFTSNSTSGIGVEGTATASTGGTFGGKFQSWSSSGRAVIGNATSETGTNYGGYFSTDSPDGYALYASSPGTYSVYGQTSATSGIAYGGYFSSDSGSGRGAYGVATATGAADTPYGVRGFCQTATLGFAVYASGDLGASGTKAFRIDHPSDPANKYLLHYSSESPFPQNFYNGNVTTDANGKAWVELPSYFADINANFKYQLTVVDDDESKSFVQAKIGKKITANRFLIMTSAPHTEVSWMVFADRNDARILHNRPTDVRDKTGEERGRYQHPEYYGKGPEMGMDVLRK